jgi:hypothetical protein
MSNQFINKAILDANIEETCNPHTGDCVSVAVAIKEIFGGEYICGYQNPCDRIPAHATVDIDGILYDGSGTTSTDALYDVATSGLKSHEIQSPDNHICAVKRLRDNSYYDKQTKRIVEERIRDEL